MEQWQIEALEKLLSRGDENSAAAAVDVSEKRLYLHSAYYGDSRYHVVSRSYDGGLVIDQIDHGEKYQQRVILEAQEVESLLRSLFLWHLEAIRRQNEAAQAEDDLLDDLDEKPF